jgi:hypothetical protein
MVETIGACVLCCKRQPGKQRRTLKQIHEDLKELGFEGSYDMVAAFARVWRTGQSERVNPPSKQTDVYPEIFKQVFVKAKKPTTT